MASVLKLSDPEALLNQVDIFIFDCDGVIWRVRTFLCDNAGTTTKHASDFR